MSQGAPAQKRTLIVTECVQIAAGQGPKGPWTIYRVSATDVNGTPIQANLKSFDQLEIGKPVEYEVTSRTTEKYGLEFTLKSPRTRGGGGTLGPKVDELRARIERIEAYLQSVGVTLPPLPTPAPAASSTPAAPSVGLQSPPDPFAAAAAAAPTGPPAPPPVVAPPGFPPAPGPAVPSPADDDIPF